MSDRVDLSLDGLGASEATAKKWSSLLVKATLAVLVIGTIVGIIIWFSADSWVGEDLGALAWVITFALSVALMSIRQILLAEKE